MTKGLPSREALLAFIRESDGTAGKREIARAFGVKGADRVDLKRMLAELAEEGLIERGARRTLRPGGRLPPVAVVAIARIDAQGDAVAVPQNWEGDGAAPEIVLAPPRRGAPAPGPGDRALAKLRPLSAEDDYAYEGRVIKILGSARRALGVFRAAADGGGRVVPVEKKADRDFHIDPQNRGEAADGELVEVETVKGPRFGLPRAKIVARLGDLGAPRSISLIAIHEHGIPTAFDPAAEREAEAAQPFESLEGREDLRDLPLVTIDPEDARDHDDAVFAEADPDPKNPGGFILWVAIADVAHYVRPGSALDADARRRGNSCYFPDRVVPMLPDRLSGDLCSLHEGATRPCLALRIVLDAQGGKREHRFMRAIMRSAASLTYEQAQAAEDGRGAGRAEALREGVIAPLFACHRALMRARERRQPLDLDLPERRVVLNEAGEVASIRFRDRFDAHRLIEECMVLANVCAAETLERKRTPLLYRVHEPPIEERVEALRETLASIGITLAKGERMTPAHLNRALAQAAGTTHAETVNLAMLRAQTQAYYSAQNLGHFGLNLARYAHFTSPIRRYADLVVHRALISALGLGAAPGRDGLSPEERLGLEDAAQHISMTERRAMAAERDSTDRYLAAYMEDRLGAEFDGIVSGVARFGLFVKLDETGADGLVPISSLGDDYYHHDERANTLTGARSKRVLRIGDRARVRLEEAAPLTGGLRFTLLEGGARKAGQKTAPAPKGARKAARARAKALKRGKRRKS